MIVRTPGYLLGDDLIAPEDDVQPDQVVAA